MDLGTPLIIAPCFVVAFCVPPFCVHDHEHGGLPFCVRVRAHGGLLFRVHDHARGRGLRCTNRDEAKDNARVRF